MKMRGKWSQRGVPHKGWHCVEMIDLEYDRTLCEMCEAQEIRYVHRMEHPEYKGSLDVGCVCAERMEQDYRGPKIRERDLINNARRKKNWTNRKWKTSKAGNFTITTDGMQITVFRKQNIWRASISDLRTGEIEYSRKEYTSSEAAKAATYDAMIFLKNRGWGAQGS